MLARVNRTYVPEFVNEYFRNNHRASACNEQVSGTVPAVNVIEGDRAYEIEVAAPGLVREDFRINIEKDLLTVSSEKKAGDQEGRFMRREFAYSAFKRSFYLPENIDTEQISASHNNGILTINLPRKKEDIKKGPRNINID